MNSCGTCSECCRLLEVEEIKKASNTICRHQVPGGCQVYSERPISCFAFNCLWLVSQTREKSGERQSNDLRPDVSHVVFYRNGDEVNSKLIFAHVDPKFPKAWQVGAVNRLINDLVQRGVVIIVVINDQRIILEKDKPVIHTTEDEVFKRQNLGFQIRKTLPFPDVSI